MLFCETLKCSALVEPLYGKLGGEKCSTLWISVGEGELCPAIVLKSACKLKSCGGGVKLCSKADKIYLDCIFIYSG